MTDHDLHALANPKLDQRQMAAIAQSTGAALARHRDGDLLFQAGDREFKFFVVQSGVVEILDVADDPPRSVAVHREGEFTGDVAHLTGTPAPFAAVARGDTAVYEVSSQGLKDLLNERPELCDVILQAFIARRQKLRQSRDFKGLRVIGSRHSRDTFRIRDFLSRNRILFTWLDLESDQQVSELLRRFGLTEADTPAVAFARRLLLRNPSNRELADALGIHKPLEKTVYDLVIVGAGPAGLAAAVYGASEGLHIAVLERSGPGGQASASMRIENYLGFPTGITGRELAERAMLQVDRFGARVTIPTPVAALSFEQSYPVLRLEDGDIVTAKSLIIATGADYRRLTEEGCDQFEGSGVFYAATTDEAPLCSGVDVVVVGGGNSAGQAAVFLSGIARKVYLVVRGDDLYHDMSYYLARRIEHTDNIEVLLDTIVVRMYGDNRLAKVEIQNIRTGEKRTIDTPALFTFIGAAPRTDWLKNQIETDDHGFVRTGTAITGIATHDGGRNPYLLETSRQGVFAAGDVRAGSVKRVASAVGEGAMAVRFVHEYLKDR
jgi:thioredoxin reductase (NADPH)